MNFLARMLASGFFFSYIPARLLGKEMRLGPFTKRSSHTGAGLLGTGLGCVLLFHLPEGGLFLLAILGASVAVAIVLSGLAERSFGKKDDPRIIIDETVGFWTAAAFLPRTTPVIATSFVLFRILDSHKLPLIRRIETLPGGLGIVLDDVFSGLVTNLALRAAILIFPAVFV